MKLEYLLPPTDTEFKDNPKNAKVIENLKIEDTSIQHSIQYYLGLPKLLEIWLKITNCDRLIGLACLAVRGFDF